MVSLAAHRTRALDLRAGEPAGLVATVDGDRIEVLLCDDEAAAVSVSDLVAMPAGEEFVVGVVASLARTGPDRIAMRVMPAGTFGGGRFRLGAACLPQVDASCFLLDGPLLGEFMGTLGEGVASGEQLVLGRYVAHHETPAVADGNRLLQRHLAVLGNTGAGKSWTVALLLERAGRLAHSNVIVLDVHGEYGTLAEPEDGSEPVARRLRIAGPADLLYGGDDALHLPYWLLERDELMSLVAGEPGDQAREHAGVERLWLGDRIQTLKRAKLAELGAGDAVATATADSPVPYRLAHLLEWAARDEVEVIVRHPTGKVDPGPYAGQLGSLISRLEARVADPRYGFIFQPPETTETTAWLVDVADKLLSAGPGHTGIKIVDLSEVPAAILPLVTAVLARLVYSVQFWMEPADRTPLCLVCDEAHVYLPAAETVGPVHKVALEAFETIAKEGRKYGVCLAVVSQRPSDVSRTILSQCNNFIVMRLTNDRDQDVVSRLVPGSMASVAGLLPMLDVGEGIVLGDALLLPVRIRLDRPRVPPASSTLPYWSLWSRKPSSADAIAAGVEALQTQWRGVE